jgi:flagellar capping protein FliD
MPSLDGYSLNEKMDEQYEELKNEIEKLRSRIEGELILFRNNFSDLDGYMKSMKEIATKKEKKDGAKQKSTMC